MVIFSPSSWPKNKVQFSLMSVIFAIHIGSPIIVIERLKGKLEMNPQMCFLTSVGDVIDIQKFTKNFHLPSKVDGKNSYDTILLAVTDWKKTR